MPEINNLDGLSDRKKLTRITQSRSEVSDSDGARGRRRRKATPVLYLTELEISALFGAIETEGKRENSRTDPIRDRALFEVAMARGLRASEVGLLELRHLRLKENRLYVTRFKGGRTGEFLITEREARALKPYLKRRGGFRDRSSPVATGG